MKKKVISVYNFKDKSNDRRNMKKIISIYNFKDKRNDRRNKHKEDNFR